METAVVVFTRDLRVHDNPALHQACDQARQALSQRNIQTQRVKGYPDPLVEL